MVLIRKYRIRKAGSRGHAVSIPNEYIEDIGIAAGQKIAMYRDEDRLVLIPERERHSDPIGRFSASGDDVLHQESANPKASPNPTDLHMVEGLQE